jgi:hypothetical protein
MADRFLETDRRHWLHSLSRRGLRIRVLVGSRVWLGIVDVHRVMGFLGEDCTSSHPFTPFSHQAWALTFCECYVSSGWLGYPVARISG